ncbi:MAG: T9SS type A sorting domain-containing protein [Bacteroidota bacterium]
MKKNFCLITALLFTVVNCFSQAGKIDLTFGSAGKVYTNLLDINRNDEAALAVAIQTDGKIIMAGKTAAPAAIFRYNTDGSPDNNFDVDGMAFCFGIRVTSIAIQSDGKIVVAGYSGNDFALARFNANGSLDNSFDGDGKLTTDIGTSYDQVSSIALQSDGKIVAAGYSYNGSTNDFALARYNTDGSLDNSFDSDGKLTTIFSASDNQIKSVAIQSDGKIVVAGSFYNGPNASDFAIVRYNTNGSPDNSFDTDGKLTTDFGATDDQAASIAVQSDGKIVVAGYSNNGNDNDFAIARYNTNGSPDNTFDGDGRLTTDIINFSSDILTSMAIQNDGKIAVAGYSNNGMGNDLAVARYNVNGSLDNSFDGDGKLATDMGSSYEQIASIALQSDGKIVGAGYTEDGITFKDNFAIVRYNVSGSLDNSFDSDGKLITNISSSYDIGRSLAVQNDGKIVVAGYTGNTDLGSNNDIALVRYNANGSLDNSFDGDGKLTTDISSSDDKVHSIAIQSDGKIVVAGTSLTGNSYDFALVRYHANGSLDNSFDGDGKLTTYLSLSDDIATSIIIQSDGKIVVAGNSYNGNDRDFALVRYNTDGSLDNSFDEDGKLLTDFGSSSSERATSIAIQSDGKIIVAGYSYNNVSNYDFALARYNTDGSLDNSFDGDGKLTTDINSFYDQVSSIALQSDGKIVVAGSAYDGTNDNNFALARYNTNGSLDNSFDGDGKLTTNMGSSVGVASIAIQNNGKIIVAGENRNNNGDGDFALARYNTDGSLDNSFDLDGKAFLDLFGGSFEHLHSMKLYADRIYLAGEMLTAGAVDFVLASVINDAVNSPLPLHLLDFSGNLVNTDALLNWKTENEVKTLEFIVERSTDGQHYIPAGSVGSANSAGTHYYNFTDPNVTSLNASILYYRLKQKDMDGRFTYSRILALPLDKSRNMVLFYPNPVINEANLTITVNRPERVNVKIIDNKGRLVKQQYWSISAGSTSLLIDVQGLAKGMYYLELKGETIRYNRQFVK